MNIVSIETGSPEKLPVIIKADAEGADLFSVLMASIAAGNGIQQGMHNVTSGSRTDFTGEASFSKTDLKDAGRNTAPLSTTSLPVEYVTGTPLDTSSTFSAPVKSSTTENSGTEGAQVLVQLASDPMYDGNGEIVGNPVIPPATQGSISADMSVADARMGTDGAFLASNNQPSEVLKTPAVSLILKDPPGGIAAVSPQENIAGRKVIDRGLSGIKTDTPGKVSSGNSARLTATAEDGEVAAPAGARPLSPDAVKNIKADIGTKDAERKSGIAASGSGIPPKAKDSDTETGITAAFGREVIEPKLVHASEGPFASAEKVGPTAQTSKIEPADLIAQVSGRIKADFKAEGGEVRIELHPDSLGHLKIEIKVDGGVVRASILTENAMVKDTIDSNISMLRSSLEDHGLMIDQLSVGVDQRQGGNAFAERKDLQGWQGFKDADAPRYQIEEPVKETWYRAAPHHEHGVSIFA